MILYICNYVNHICCFLLFDKYFFCIELTKPEVVPIFVAVNRRYKVTNDVNSVMLTRKQNIRLNEATLHSNFLSK